MVKILIIWWNVRCVKSTVIYLADWHSQPCHSGRDNCLMLWQPPVVLSRFKLLRQICTAFVPLLYHGRFCRGPPVGMLIGLLQKDGSVTRIDPSTWRSKFGNVSIAKGSASHFGLKWLEIRDPLLIEYHDLECAVKPKQPKSHRNGKSNMVKLFKRQILWGKI